MADQITNYGRYLMKTADGEPSGMVDWIADTIRVALVNASLYTFDVTHKYLSDIPENARIYITEPLTGKTVSTIGAAAAADVAIESLEGPPVGALAVFKDVDSDPTKSPFFLWLDSYGNLPAFIVGKTFRIYWPQDANRIYR